MVVADLVAHGVLETTWWRQGVGWHAEEDEQKGGRICKPGMPMKWRWSTGAGRLNARQDKCLHSPVTRTWPVRKNQYQMCHVFAMSEWSEHISYKIFGSSLRPNCWMLLGGDSYLWFLPNQWNWSFSEFCSQIYSSATHTCPSIRHTLNGCVTSKTILAPDYPLFARTNSSGSRNWSCRSNKL